MGLGVYFRYIQSSGLHNFFFTIFLFALSIAIRIGLNLYVGSWIDKNSWIKNYGLDDDIFPLIYLGGLVLTFIVFAIRSVFFGIMVSSASYNMFDGVISNILRRPVSFFDTTPSGVILNRCIMDVGELDFKIPNQLTVFFEFIFDYIGTLILIGIAAPYTFILILVLVVTAAFNLRRYIISATELKRILKLAISPLLSKVNEMITGATVLRTFGLKDHVLGEFEKISDILTSVFLHEYLSSMWFRVRTEYTIFALVAVTMFCITINRDIQVVPFVNPTVMSLVLTYMLTIGSGMGKFLKSTNEIMRDMNSFERVKEYLDFSEQEADWKVPEAPKGWPENGEIEAMNVQVRYREGLPLVLKGVDFKIGHKEKIGIVGRTGSGKSTLVLALMRIIELAKEEGEMFIKIAGQNISELGLHWVRQAIEIVPQDPQLVEGTLKFNLDPTNQFSEEEIIKKLEKVGVLEALETLS